MMYRNNLANPREIIPIVLVALIAPFVIATTHAHAGAAPDPRGAARPGGPSEEVEMPIERVYALCIGVRDYASHRKFDNLPGALNDARAMHAVFSELYQYNSTLLPDSDASREGIQTHLDRITQAAGEHDAIVIYFAGHGHTITQSQYSYGFIVPHGTRVPDEVGAMVADEIASTIENEIADEDGDEAGEGGQDESGESETNLRSLARDRIESSTLQDPEWLGERYMRIDVIRDQLLSSDAKHVVMLFDSCFSGAVVNLDLKLTSARGGSGFDELARFDRLSKGSRVVLTAGMADQEVYEDPYNGSNRFLYRNKKHGVFSRMLIETLADEGQPARTSYELYDDAYDRVIEWYYANKSHVGEMTPQRRLLGLQGGDFVFVQNPTNAWIERVRAQVKNLNGAGGTRADGRGSAGAKPRRRPGGKTRAERRVETQQTQTTRGDTGPGYQTQLDLMVVSQEANLVTHHGKPHDPTEPRWRNLIERNRKLASLGDPVAGSVMAIANETGIGVEARDPSRARTWAVEARDTGNSEGAAALEMINAAQLGASLSDAMSRLRAGGDLDASSIAAFGFAVGSMDEESAPGLLKGLAGGFGEMAEGVVGFFKKEKDPEKLAEAMNGARGKFLTQLDTGGSSRKLKSDLSDWSDAARNLLNHARRDAPRGTLYEEAAPTVADALLVALARLEQAPRDSVALDNALRYTDELVALVSAQYTVGS